MLIKLAKHILKIIKTRFDDISVNFKTLRPFYYKFVLDGKDIIILIS